MKHSDIRVGDLLALRKDNPYGLPPLAVRVTDLRYRDGYKVPWVIVDQPNVSGAFRPRDFKGRA